MYKPQLYQQKFRSIRALSNPTTAASGIVRDTAISPYSRFGGSPVLCHVVVS